MVRHLNPEWKFFGPRYNVPGAMVDKVNCSACEKQVSASVNRLKSHLRKCPGRPLELAAPNANGAAAPPPSITAVTTASATALPVPATAPVTAPATAPATAMPATGAIAAGTTSPHVPLERQQPAPNAVARTIEASRPSAPAPPTRSAIDNAVALAEALQEPLRAVPASALAPAAAPSTVERTGPRWVAIEEKRLQLEMKREEREERRESLQLAILEAQMRREKIAADRESCEAKVQLVLARKRLRDEGVAESEIESILPVPRD